MSTALRAAVCAYVHSKGWCEFLHREPSSDRQWSRGCPFADRILYDLFPPQIFVGSVDAFETLKARGQRAFEPGAVISDPGRSL